MRQKELSLLFEAGDLLSAMICAVPMQPGCYQLMFKRRSGAPVLLLPARAPKADTTPRVFTTLDGAWSVCQAIGFREARIVQS